MRLVTIILCTFYMYGFIPQNSLLFAGYRNGKCCVWDTRLDSKSAVTFQERPAGTRLSSSIIAIHPLLDPNYVISNALNSNVSCSDVLHTGGGGGEE